LALDHEVGMKPWTGSVLPEWLDYNGHMTEHRYLQVFGEASDQLYEYIGVEFLSTEGGSYFTSESHIRHLAEAKVGMLLTVTTEVLGFDAKRLHILHTLCSPPGATIATGEHLAVHVRNSIASTANSEMLRRISELYSMAENASAPSWTGSVLRKPLVTMRVRET
jgi:acyl-CoA thioester hydrolase